MIELNKIVWKSDGRTYIAKINGFEIFTIWSDGKEWFSEIPTPRINDEHKFKSVKEAQNELTKEIEWFLNQISG